MNFEESCARRCPHFTRTTQTVDGVSRLQLIAPTRQETSLHNYFSESRVSDLLAS